MISKIQVVLLLFHRKTTWFEAEEYCQRRGEKLLEPSNYYDFIPVMEKGYQGILTHGWPNLGDVVFLGISKHKVLFMRLNLQISQTL